MTAAYRGIIAAPPRDRLDLFLATANRLGAPVANVEKDFWVCWTLNALFRERPAGGPRLLFKGGTSLSMAHGLIRRFSEDIDITVFRDDLGEPASVEDLARLSNKKRRVRLDAIRDACRPISQVRSMRPSLPSLPASPVRRRARKLIPTIPTARPCSSIILRSRRPTAFTFVRPSVSNPARSLLSIRTAPLRSGLMSPMRLPTSI